MSDAIVRRFADIMAFGGTIAGPKKVGMIRTDAAAPT